MSEFRRPPPPTLTDHQRPAPKHAAPASYRLSNVHKPAVQEPDPGYQDFFTRRFDLTRWMLDHHTRLTVRRSNSALCIVVIDLLAAALSFWIYAISASSGITFFFQLIILLLLFVIWGCLLLAIILAFSASIWRRSSPNEGSETDAFFESGDRPPDTTGIGQSQSLFSKQFRQINQDVLLSSSLNAVWNYAKRRKVQEQQIRIAVFSTIIGFFGLGLVAIAALLGMF